MPNWVVNAYGAIGALIIFAPCRVKFYALFALVVLFALIVNARAEDDRHAQGHNSYRGWASQKTGNCCDNQDCKWLEETEWRESNAGTEVQINGEWCPVKPEHLLLKGKSPDWTKAHACINRRAYNMPACERLLCFVGAPKG